MVVHAVSQPLSQSQHSVVVTRITQVSRCSTMSDSDTEEPQFDSRTVKSLQRLQKYFEPSSAGNKLVPRKCGDAEFEVFLSVAPSRTQRGRAVELGRVRVLGPTCSRLELERKNLVAEFVPYGERGTVVRVTDHGVPTTYKFAALVFFAPGLELLGEADVEWV